MLIENKKVDEYINEVCSLVKNKRVHENIRYEIMDHIESITEEYVDNGCSIDEAVDKAILSMGSSTDIGNELNRVHKAKCDWVLIGLNLVLVLVGIFTLWAIGENSLNNHLIDYSYCAENTFIYIAIGLILSVVITRLDYRRIKSYSKYLYIISLLGIVLGNTDFCCHGFLRIFNNSFDIFSLSAFILIISLCGIYDELNCNDKKHMLKGVILSFAPVILFVSSRMAVGIIICVAIIVLMIVSGFKLSHLLICTSATIVMFGTVFLSNPYRKARLLAMINPLEDPEGSGWIYNQLYNIRKSAGLLVRSDELNLKLLPNAEGDFILTYIIYSFGTIACISLIICISAFIIRIIFIAKKTKESYGKLLVSGLCALIAVQFIMNILMNFNIGPVIGVALPFISYGGTNLITSLICISLINSVHKWRNTPFKSVV